MSVFVPSDNKLVTCPYDEAHKVKESRLQLHIAKCKLNHLDLTKRVCPFNATHLLQQGEYDHHLINCPDRGALDRHLAQGVDKNNPFKGRTDLPQYSDPIFVDESWEIDTHTVRTTPLPPGGIVEPREMSKPAERKQLYRSLHQASSETESTSSNSPIIPSSVTPSAIKVTSLRQPKQPSESQRIQNIQNIQSSNQMINCLGLGRGRQPSRIAANFPQANVSSGPPSYSNIVSNLGLGRGMSNKPSQGPTSNFSSDYDDFPALGLGRGRPN